MPGCYDGLSAKLVAAAGFQVTFMSGFAVSAARLGMPDTGLISFTEMLDSVRNCCAAAGKVPVIGDGDTGYGNALNVQRTVRMFERAGASAIQLEDQTLPKRCGHLRDKTLIPAAEMVGKVRAALDARASEATLVIARTDAVAVEGVGPAIDRARRYAEAGADVLFVEAPRNEAQLLAVSQKLGGRLPLMANMVEGGQTPILGKDKLQALGFSLVIFPGGIVRAVAKAAKAFYETLARDGTTEAFRNDMFDFDALNELIGTPQMLDLGQSYEFPANGPSDKTR